MRKRKSHLNQKTMKDIEPKTRENHNYTRYYKIKKPPIKREEDFLLNKKKELKPEEVEFLELKYKKKDIIIKEI